MAIRPTLLLLPLIAGTLVLAPPAAGPAWATLERAQAAQARGDLRAAQIELRNAVRNNPNDPALRAALALASLEVGDGDTAEKEARAALDRGYDPVDGTRILLRAYLAQNRARDLLRDFPPRETPPGVGGQVAAARALAQLAGDDRSAARQSVADALRLAPDAAEPHLAAASLAQAEGDRTAAEAAVDKALAAQPGQTDAVLRKAGMQFGRGDAAGAAETLAPLLQTRPGHVQARILRAEALMRLGRDDEARAEVDAALRTQPNSAPATYLRGVLFARARDWRAADEVFQRLGAALGNFPEGFLFAASARREIGQLAQAEDLAQRYVARRPEDPRGAKLLAVLAMADNRPEVAAGVLTRLADRGAADAEAFDLLGRARTAARQPREAAAAFERAVALAPEDAGLKARLAAARLAAGDTAGMAQAARQSLQQAPEQAGAREMLAVAALSRGDLDAAQAELDRLPPEARRSEAAGVLEGTIRLGRLDFAGARAAFEKLLREHPDSLGGRLGLARVFLAQNEPAEAERIYADVLRREPNNGEALQRLATLAARNSPRAAQARGVLEAANAAAPGAPALALTLASVLTTGGDPARAAQVLEAPALKAPGLGAALPLARAQVYAVMQRWPEAEAAARTALAEAPDSTQARRQLAALLARDGQIPAAETLVREGLRERPGDAVLQQTLVGLVQQARGPDAALALAEEMAKQGAAQPASRFLKGDLLLSQRKPAEAAQAFAAQAAEAPSAALALREAQAWRVAGQTAKAVQVLSDWLKRDPESVEALDVLASIDIEAGRNAEAARRLEAVVARQPGNGAALNNLAWILGEQGDAASKAKAKAMAERAFFLLPSAETADTLGWIMTRQGEAARAVPLMRQAAAAAGAASPPNRGIVYRYAATLRMAGQREEARRVLESLLDGNSDAFPERVEAERMLAELKAGR